MSGMKLGSETGSLNNWMASRQSPDVAEDVQPGDGATILMWTDRTPATVVDVIADPRGRKTKKAIRIRRDRYEAIPGVTNAMTDSGQVWKITPDPDADIEVVKYRAGAWRLHGDSDGLAVSFGRREYFRDPSF